MAISKIQISVEWFWLISGVKTVTESTRQFTTVARRSQNRTADTARNSSSKFQAAQAGVAQPWSLNQRNTPIQRVSHYLNGNLVHLRQDHN